MGRRIAVVLVVALVAVGVTSCTSACDADCGHSSSTSVVVPSQLHAAAVQAAQRDELGNPKDIHAVRSRKFLVTDPSQPVNRKALPVRNPVVWVVQFEAAPQHGTALQRVAVTALVSAKTFDILSSTTSGPGMKPDLSEYGTVVRVT